MNITRLITIVLAAAALSACGKIHTGHAGVRTAWDGKVSSSLEGEGFYTSWTSHVDEFSAKEIAIPLDNLTPKAKDNLSLAELDVTVYYKVKPEAIREIFVKRTGMSTFSKEADVWLPAYSLVESVSKDRVADVVSKIDSLVIHTQRDTVAIESQREIQKALDATDPGMFTITRVAVRGVKTDASIEQSIRNVVAKEKELETATLNVQVAQKNADAVAKTAVTLTPAYLQHEYNQVLMKFADKGGTIILDGSSSQKILNLGK
jgi:hypothetical protein